MLLEAVAVCGYEAVSSLPWGAWGPGHTFRKEELFAEAVVWPADIVPDGTHVACGHQRLNAGLLQALLA